MIKLEQTDDLPILRQGNIVQAPPQERQQKAVEKNTQKIIRKHYDRWHTKTGCKWSLSENRQYLNFLLSSSHLFNLPLEEKKKIKVNVLLSKRIPSRTSTQCRSHHQKMVQKYSSIEKVIEELNKIFVIPLLGKKTPKKNSKGKGLEKVKKQQKQKSTESMEQKQIKVKTEEMGEIKEGLIKEDQQVDYIYFSTCE